MIIYLQIILICITIILISKIFFNSINQHLLTKDIISKENKELEMIKAYKEILDMYNKEFKENKTIINNLKNEYTHYKYIVSSKRFK